MHALLPELAGLALGIALRRRTVNVLRYLIRGQTLLLVMPLSLLGGLVFQFKPVSVISMATLIGAESLGIIAGSYWYRRRHGEIGIAHVASSPNSGLWNIPIAAAFLQPASIIYLAVFDVVSAPRNLLLIGTMRRNAPQRQRASSGLIDFAPPFFLSLGLGIQWLVGRPALGGVLIGTSFVNVGIGMLLIGLSAPLEWPVLREDIHVLPPAFLLRWLLPLSSLFALVACGIHPPTVAWLLAISPAFWSQLSYSALYGYSRRQALLIVIATALVSLTMLPLVLSLAR